ncbi:MAG: GDSL-type esterase/lipase family protein [Planctomycetaceae bacterium]
MSQPGRRRVGWLWTGWLWTGVVCLVTVCGGPSVVPAADRPAADLPGGYSPRLAVLGVEQGDGPAVGQWSRFWPGMFSGRVVVESLGSAPFDPTSEHSQAEWRAALEQRPDWIFVQVAGPGAREGTEAGAGDAAPGRDLTGWQQALRDRMLEARAAKVRPVLVTAPGVFGPEKEDASAAAARETPGAAPGHSPAVVAEGVWRVARDVRVPVLDLQGDTRALVRRLAEVDPQGEWLAAITHDAGVERGARALAALVAQAIPGQVPGLISRLDQAAIRAALPVAVEGCGLPRLLLPGRLHAVVGAEVNLYFDNMLLWPAGADIEVDVQCPQGAQQADRWTWIPGAEGVGEHPLEVTLRDFQGEVLARGRTTVVVAPAQAGAGQAVSLLLVGDSLTHASQWPARLLERARGEGEPRLSLLGTHQPAGVAEGVRHEGYGGWTAQRFATHFVEGALPDEVKLRGSPFLVRGPTGAPRLDFGAYLERVQAPAAPDVVAIFLGPNDIFGLTGTNLEEGLDVMLRHLRELIEMVERAAPRTKVALLVALPPAASQDAFGANYKAGQTRWQYRRNQHRLAEWLRLLYDRPGAEAGQVTVELVATHLQVDCRHGYPAVEVPWHADSSVKGLRQNNGVHPDANGYRQVGDAFYAWLKCHLHQRSVLAGQ